MTEQVPDWIQYQGNGYRLWSGPNLPSGLCDLEFVSQSSDNWRGYIARWFVEDDFLYLAALTGGVCLNKTLPILNCQITPQDGGLAAEWFSGELKLLLPETDPDTGFERFGGFESKFILLSVSQGRIVETALINGFGNYLEPPKSNVAHYETPLPAQRLRLEVIGSRESLTEMETSWECRPEGGRVGRAPSSQWRLPSREISHEHFLISYEDGRFIVDPLRSPNGIFHNRRRNRVTNRLPLQNGDKLWIGPYEIAVTVCA